MNALVILRMLLAMSFALPGAADAHADEVHRLELHADSRIRLEGSTTLGEFSCYWSDLSGALLHLPSDVGGNRHAVRAALTIPVDSINCRRSRMKPALLRALKTADHPDIVYELDRVEQLEPARDSAGRHELLATGLLTVAGTTRRIETRVVGEELPGGRLRAVGSQDLLMSDFGVEPPTAMLGFLRTRDSLTIHFDLIAVLTNEPATPGVSL